MMQVHRQKRRSGQAGFTLIELLVVVVILGVLSAVVVFAVRGTGDKGQAAALDTDERTIRTAQESFCANNNRYAEMGTPGQAGTLVGDRYLSEPSTLHDVFPSNPGDGPCNGWKYRIEPKNGTATTTTPTTTGSTTSTTEPPIVCTNPLGCWNDVAAPKHLYGYDEILLPNGQILSWTDNDTNTNTRPDAQLYNPKANTWTDVAYPPCHDESNNCEFFHIDHAVVLKGSQAVCGSNCGKVLMFFSLGGISFTNSRWGLYDPATGLTSDANSSTAPYKPEVGNTVTLLWAAACETAPLPGWCGKVLAVGGKAGGGRQPATIDGGAQLYDPFLGTWTATSPLNTGRTFHFASVLADGRVMIVGGVSGNTLVTTAEIYDPANPVWRQATGQIGRQRVNNGRNGRQTALLADGRVLIAGGAIPNAAEKLAPQLAEDYGAEVFNPAGEQFTRVGGCGNCSLTVQLTPLPDGRILTTGLNATGEGSTRLFVPASSPSSGAFVGATPSPLGFGGILIGGTSATCGPRCGTVLVVGRDGGDGGFDNVNTRRAQVYSPPPP